MAIVGRREAEAGTVTLRVRGADKRQATMPVDEAIERLVAEKTSRAPTLEAVPAKERVGAPA
jgi:threonyl-tRNA synthetase